MDTTIDLNKQNLSNNQYDVVLNPYSEYDEKSKWSILEHTQDNIKHTGYDYKRKGIFSKVISSVFYLETKRASIINMMDRIWVKSVDDIKRIKKTFNYIIDQDYTKFN